MGKITYVLLCTASLSLGAIADTVSNTRIDPTRPANFTKQNVLLGAQKGKLPIAVKGIFNTPKHRYAIINETTVKVGDEINDLRVVAITPSSVSFRKLDGSNQELQVFSIYEQEVKSDATR